VEANLSSVAEFADCQTAAADWAKLWQLISAILELSALGYTWNCGARASHATHPFLSAPLLMVLPYPKFALVNRYT
jgi:hypothetical protein